MYNFAFIPHVKERDDFFRVKQLHLAETPKKYQSIELPKNSAFGVVMSVWVFIFGFSVIWHYAPTILIAALGIVITFIHRSFQTETTYRISATEVEAIEKQRAGVRA